MTGTLVVFALGLLTGWKFGKRKRDDVRAPGTSDALQKRSSREARAEARRRTSGTPTDPTARDRTS